MNKPWKCSVQDCDKKQSGFYNHLRKNHKISQDKCKKFVINKNPIGRPRKNPPNPQSQIQINEQFQIQQNIEDFRNFFQDQLWVQIIQKLRDILETKNPFYKQMSNFSKNISNENPHLPYIL
ncbi:hypothetical protein ABPG72_004235 [Tetrahymena utriculariae]